MSTFLMIVEALLIIIGVPAMIIMAVVNLIKKKSVKFPLYGILVCIFLAFSLLIIQVVSINGFFVTVAALLFFVAIPISIIFIFVNLIRKNSVKIPLISVGASIFLTILFVIIGFVTSGTSNYENIPEQQRLERLEQKRLDALEEQEKETEVSNNLNTSTPTIEPEITIEPTVDVVPTINPTPNVQIPKELTEQEYKNACRHIYYDEVFFGKEDLENKFVKINVFLSEKMFIEADAIYSDTARNFVKNYNINRDFYHACVLREGTTSYVGRSIDLYFSNNYNLKPSDYKTGQKITIYGEVVSWSNNTWDGYNNVQVIPKYIEK